MAGSTPTLRLYPPPSRQMDAKRIYEDLELPGAQGGGARARTRPYVIINMVASLDGKTTLGGKAARIGSRIDRQVMRTLRSKADAVMVGANTLRAERLSLGLDAPSSGPQPLAIIVSKAGVGVPLEENLLIPDGGQTVLMIVAADAAEGAADRSPHGRPVLVRIPTAQSGEVDREVDLEKALRILRAEYAVDLLLVEGGPSLNHALISARLADELFLTLAPKLLGGTRDESLTILSGDTLPEGAGVLTLLSAHSVGGELFLRYALGR